MRISAESRQNVDARCASRPKRHLLASAVLISFGSAAAPAVAGPVERSPLQAPHPELCVDLNGVLIGLGDCPETTNPPIVTLPITVPVIEIPTPDLPVVTVPAITVALTTSPPTTPPPATAPPSTTVPPTAPTTPVTVASTTTTTTVAAGGAGGVAIPPGPTPTCSIYVAVYLGTSGSPATCVETRLRQLNYWLVGPDGNFDSTAVHALKMFQRKYGLPESGIADYRTLQALRIWRTPPTIPAPTCAVAVTVRLGDAGPAARCVEERLRQHGYWLVVDGRFDSTAVQALKVFEDRQGLRADGIADFYALTRLRIWGAVGPPAPLPNPCPIYATVRPGTVGSSALCVETRLHGLGFSIVPDRTFDTAAVNALRAFQQLEGLPVTGIADVATLRALGIYRDPPRPAAPTCTVSAVVSSSGAGTLCLETRLRQYNYTLTPDTTFDAATAAVLRVFQDRNGLPITGVGDVATLKALSIWTEQPDPWDLARLTREAVGAANYDRLAATVQITYRWAEPPGGWLAYAQGTGNGTYLITIHPAMRTYPRDALLDLLAHEWAHVADWASPPTGGILGRITDEICAEAIADATASKLRGHPVNAHPVDPLCPAPDITRRVIDILDL